MGKGGRFPVLTVLPVPLKHSSLNGQPVAVTQFNSGGFVAVSHEARSQGVRKGDGIGAGGHRELAAFKHRPDARMKDVLLRCPGLKVLPMDTSFYRAKSREVYQRLQQGAWRVDPGQRLLVEQSSIDGTCHTSRQYTRTGPTHQQLVIGHSCMCPILAHAAPVNDVMESSCRTCSACIRAPHTSTSPLRVYGRSSG